MNFIERLEFLMNCKGVNRAQLADESGIPRNTVYGWWSRGWEQITLPRLRTLCDYFGCTMDYLVNGPQLDDSKENQEHQLIAAYWGADETTRGYALELLLSHQTDQRKDPHA